MNIIRKYKISKITGIPLEGLDAEIISFMKEIIEDLILFKYKYYSDSIYYMNSEGKCIFEQDNERGYFWVNYNTVWGVLEREYFMSYSEIQDIVKYMVKEAFKQKISTPMIAIFNRFEVEEVFKKLKIF